MSFIPQWKPAGSLLSLEVLKYGGFLLMLIDHANRYLLLQQPWMEQAGRAVFPIFAIVLGVGLSGEGGRDRASRLLVPLLVGAIFSHVAALPLVGLELRGELLNVLATLGAGCLLIAGWGEAKAGWVLVAAGALLSWWSEYGPIGAALVLAAYLGHGVTVWALLALLSVSQMTVVPVFVPVMFWVADVLCGGERWRSPRMLFASGYVVQFACFSALATWLALGRA